MGSEIRRTAAQVQQELDRTLVEYQRATGDYEFELSLRGMRVVIPLITDTIIREMNQAIGDNLNEYWPKRQTVFGPVEARGKSEALKYANKEAEPYRQRLRDIKRLMPTGDSATVRAGLKTAINQILSYTNLKITYRVADITITITITIFEAQIISAAFQQQLRTALTAIDLLPEKSNIMVRARDVWERIPKREVLLATAKAIEQGAGAMAPRIASIGFRFPVNQPTWQLNVAVIHNGAQRTLTLALLPAKIAEIGPLTGSAFAQILN